jgi:hypothetical protein
MPAIGFELLVVLLLIVANGVFALAEMALVSARKARLQQWAEEGNAQARTALELGENPGEFLSTVQIGIALVGILAGAFGGPRLTEPLAAALRSSEGLQTPLEAGAAVIPLLRAASLRACEHRDHRHQRMVRGSNGFSSYGGERADTSLAAWYDRPSSIWTASTASKAQGRHAPTPKAPASPASLQRPSTSPPGRGDVRQA